METTELRLTNRVIYEGHECAVTGIDLINVRLSYFKNESKTTSVIVVPDIKDVDPIPLTPKILLELGYSKSRNFWQIKGHSIYCPTDGMYVCDKNGVVLKYAHKLQNLFYEINKEELVWK